MKSVTLWGNLTFVFGTYQCKPEVLASSTVCMPAANTTQVGFTTPVGYLVGENMGRS